MCFFMPKPLPPPEVPEPRPTAPLPEETATAPVTGSKREAVKRKKTVSSGVNQTRKTLGTSSLRIPLLSKTTSGGNLNYNS